MIVLTVLCYLVALICFVLAAFGVPAPVDLVPAGLAFFVLPAVIGGVAGFGSTLSNRARRDQ